MPRRYSDSLFTVATGWRALGCVAVWEGADADDPPGVHHRTAIGGQCMAVAVHPGTTNTRVKGDIERHSVRRLLVTRQRRPNKPPTMAQDDMSFRQKIGYTLIACSVGLLALMQLQPMINDPTASANKKQILQAVLIFL
eukprot:229897-Chlamydomonas_euryale.AAC.17